MPDGGELAITTLRRMGPSGQVIVVEIRDGGKGIAESMLNSIFDPFVTTKRNGTGLGLALVAKVIGDHGGVIEFESQPRRTVFQVFLPVSTSAEIAQDGSE